MATHQDQPAFHLYDPNGWVNDPNGPLYYKGKYHMFFQNVADSNKWTWGLGWAHATSTDLLHWQHQPPALLPEPGWHDADGCFSGCATVDTDGTPVILYTGVRKKPDAGEREGMPLTVNKLCYETQLIARPADPDDPDLKIWIKSRDPIISDHMSGLPLNCFRDPFILEQPSDSNEWRWRIMVGSNIEVPLAAAAAAADEGDSGGGDGQITTLGTATVYRSRTKDLEGGWEYDGLLCVAAPGEGAIWECPIMVPMRIEGLAAAAPPPAAAAELGTNEQHGHQQQAQQQPPPAESQSANLTGAVAAIANETQQNTAARWQQQQQQQQRCQDDVERAMSGCLGLWDGPENMNSNSSNITLTDTLMQQQQQYDQQQQQQQLHAFSGPTHLFSVSAGVCPAIYWLGRYSNGRFDLDASDGPHALDLGDVLYAPNLMEDAQGRQIIWGWLQEHPSPLSHDYSGCISTPRQLTLGLKRHKNNIKITHDSNSTAASSSSSSSTKGGLRKSSSSSSLKNITGAGDALGQQDDTTAAAAAAAGSSDADVEYYLIQKPIPELDQLRSGRGLRLRGIQLPAGKPWSVPSQVSASHLDLKLTVTPTPGAKRFQILLGPLRQEGEQQQQQQHQQHQQQQQGEKDTSAAAAGVQQEANPAVDMNGSHIIAAEAAATATGASVEAQSDVLAAAAAGSSSIIPVVSAGASGAFAAAAAAGTTAEVSSPGSSSRIPSTPHSPTENAVLPLLPVVHGQLAAAAGSNDLLTESSGAAAAAAAAAAASPTAVGSSSMRLRSNALGSQSHTSLSSDAIMADYNETAAAMAAAAAIEQVAQEHHQAAAITYEFATAQLQVLVGPPVAVLKLLKQQQEELAAAAANNAPPAAAASNGHMASRSAVPTSDTLGFEPPVLPPAPTGALTDVGFMAAAQAADVRVLACQLRELNPSEPFELRLLLDYSIIECFFSTGEALTTRVYRGVPTARAKETSMRKVAAHAATEAAEAADAAISDQGSMSGSLANLGLLLQQQLMRSGSGRLLSAAATPRAGVAAAAAAFTPRGSLNLLSPSTSFHAALHHSGSGIQGFDSPAESPKVLGFSSKGGIQQQGSITATQILVRQAGSLISSTVRTSQAGAVDSPESLSGLTSPTHMSHSPGDQMSHQVSNHPRRLSAPSAPANVPFSPRTVVHGSYVQYFSPARVYSARVGWRAPTAAAAAAGGGGLPSLTGIMEDQTAAAAAAGPHNQAGSSSSGAADLLTSVASLLANANSSASDQEQITVSGEPGDAEDTAAARSMTADLSGHEAAAAAVTEDAAAIAVPKAAAAAPSRLIIPDPATASPTLSPAAANTAAAAAAAAAAAELEESPAGSFPGFSPHRPLIATTDMLAGGGGVLGSAAAAALGQIGVGHGSSSSSSAGEKLTSWFQKMTMGGKDDGSRSSSAKVVVPASFGHPVPPLFAAASGDASSQDAAATAAGDVGSSGSLRDQSRTAAAHKAAAAVTKPGLQIRTSSGTSKSLATTRSSATTAAASDTASVKTASKVADQQQQQQPAASSAPTFTTISSSSSSAAGPHPVSTYSAARSPIKRISAASSDGSSSQPGSARSPRRNWRSAFIFSESDDEEESDLPVIRSEDQSGVISHEGLAGSSTTTGRGLSQAPAGPQAQPGVIRTSIPFGVLHSDPQVAEFGMYAKVLAPAAATAVGPISKRSIATLPPMHQTPTAAAGGGVGECCLKSPLPSLSSGYVPGAMRELSLVALGGGGVVLRLEAHEMNSIWDKE